MYRINSKNCFVSGCVVTCLTLILFFITIFYLISRLDVMSWVEERIDGSNFYKSTQSSHLIHKDKNIIARVGFISDSESDWNNLKLALSELKKRQVNDVFHLGDITVLGVPSDLALAKGYFDESGLNVYPIPGDRDLWKSKGIDAFLETFSNSYGVIDINGVRFLLVDNSDEYEGISDVQLSFITDNFVGVNFVLLHNPIYFGTRSLWGKGMGEYSVSVDLQRKNLLDMFRSEHSIAAVFSGDQHLFSESIDDNRETLFHYVIGSLSSKRNVELPNIAILTVYDDGDYYVQKISI